MSRHRSESPALAALFTGATILVAAALTPFRTSLGQTNIALVLVLLVIGAASAAGRWGGVVAGLTASISYNFFHTKPYLTVRIADVRDIATVGLLIAVGLAVGELGVARARQSAARRSHLRTARSLEQVNAALAAGAELAVVWPVVQHGLVDTLGVRAARFEPGEHVDELPLIAHDGHVHVRSRRYVDGGFVLPEQGVALAVEANGEHLGRIRLDPDPSIGVSLEQRRAAVALSDALALALRGHSPLVALS